MSEGLGGVQAHHQGGYCLPCLRGFHCDNSGRYKDCKCTHKLGETTVVLTTSNINDSATTESPEPTDAINEKRSVGRTRVRRLKRDDALKDQQSTGRKRAAQLYPFLSIDGRVIKRGDGTQDADRRDCEWAGKDNCGGGTSPIQGCGQEGNPRGKQHARHHGPDKNTVNNEPGNVHRICHSCHNRWHAANDPDYVPGKPLLH